MNFTTTLIDIGGAAPSVLEGVVGSDCNTALEVVRRAACTGAREVLEAPPPALLHESKIPTAHLLYGAQKSCQIQDGPYKQMDPAADLTRVTDAQRMCLGGMIMDVTKNISRPAILWACQDSETKTIALQVEVWRAPIAAMEAELFQDSATGAFERRWMGESEAVAARQLRRDVGGYVRRSGYESMPQWMHASEFYVSRPGPLPLLRLRRPKDHAEVSELALHAEHMCAPALGAKPLKEIIDELDTSSNWRVTAQTTFYTQPETDQPVGYEGCHGVNEALGNSIVGPLALLVMKHLENCDYYDVVVEHEASEAHADEADASSDDSNQETQRVKKLLEDLVVREQALPVAVDGGPAVNHRTDNVLMRVLGPTGRPCDSKILVRSSLADEAAAALATRFFSESDAVLLKRRYTSQSTLDDMVLATGRLMVPRQALLLMLKAKDGKLEKCRLVAHDGDWPIANERISRYALCPWVVPIVLDAYDSVIEIKVQGVVRETLRLSERARIEHALPQTVTATFPPEVAEFFHKASTGLAQLPALVRRLESLESSLRQAAMAPPAPTPAAAAPAPPAREPCEVERGFKRANDHIAAYDRAVAQRAR